MPIAVKISDELAKNAKIKSKIYKRSIAGQIEYWATIGQIVEDNPGLPLPFIYEILTAKEQIKAGKDGRPPQIQDNLFFNVKTSPNKSAFYWMEKSAIRPNTRFAGELVQLLLPCLVQR